MLTITERRIVCRHLRNEYSTNPRNIRFEDDGAVTMTVDRMPNTNEQGRIFAGWDTELLRDALRASNN